MRPELVLDLVELSVVMHESQQLADERRQAVRQPVNRAEVEHAEPAVGEQAEVARMRVRMQQARAGPENRKRAISTPARSRSAIVPPAMILASGMPSIHSVTSTWSVTATTCGTQTSGSLA